MHRHRPLFIISMTLILAIVYLIVSEFGEVEDLSSLLIKMAQRVS